MRVLWLILLVACGSKTGLAVDVPPSHDAGIDVPELDGGFDTFPCRWTYLGDTVIYSSDSSIPWVTGAVHATGPTAFVGVSGASDDEVHIRVAISELSSVVWTRPRPRSQRGEIMPAEDGFRVVVERDCSFDHYDFDGELERTSPSGREGACLVSTSFEGRVAVGEQRVDTVDLTTGEVSRFGTVFDRFLSGRHLVLSRQGVFLLPAEVGLVLPVARLGGTDFVLVGGGSRWIGSAPDRLNGGMVAMWEASDGPQLAILDGVDVRSIDISTVDAPVLVARPPLRSVVTNETEAIFLSTSGSLFHAPLSGSPLRSIPESFSSGRVTDRSAVLLVDGGSAGGVLYVQTRPDGGDDVHFRTLVCNR